MPSDQPYYQLSDALFSEAIDQLVAFGIEPAKARGFTKFAKELLGLYSGNKAHPLVGCTTELVLPPAEKVARGRGRPPKPLHAVPYEALIVVYGVFVATNVWYVPHCSPMVHTIEGCTACKCVTTHPTPVLAFEHVIADQCPFHCRFSTSYDWELGVKYCDNVPVVFDNFDKQPQTFIVLQDASLSQLHTGAPNAGMDHIKNLLCLAAEQISELGVKPAPHIPVDLGCDVRTMVEMLVVSADHKWACI